MSNELVGLENIPNVYIAKITLNDATTESYTAKVQLQVVDVKKPRKGFIWKSDKTFFNYLKVCLVRTSNVKLANSIKSGALSPHPLEITQSPHYDAKETRLEKVSIREFFKSVDDLECLYDKNVTFEIAYGVKDFIIFSFCYIDTQDLSNHFEIDLGGLLKQYFGAITSEKIIENYKTIPLTSLFVKSNNDIWSGPIHLQKGQYMVGSFHSAKSHEQLRELKVQNLKLSDARTILYKNKTVSTRTSNPIFSDLHYSINHNIDLLGIFAIDFKQLVLLKTKYGQTMADVSQNLFIEFLSSVAVNSISVIKQQVKTIKVANSVGTPKISTHKVDRYTYLTTTLDDSPNNLKATPYLQQIYLDTDYKMRHYQFKDPHNDPRTKGQFSYKIDLSIVDRSQEFINRKMQEMQNNISQLKEKVYLLNKRSSFDYHTGRLKKGKTVPPIILDIIKNYCITQSYFKLMDDFEINYEINQRMTRFTTANYTSIEGEKFIKEFEALATRFNRKFKINSKYNVTTKPKNNKKSFIPNLISLSYQFEQIIQFSDYRRYYNYLEEPIDLNNNITQTKLTQRANLETSRFFNLDKSKTPAEFDNLKDSTAAAITATQEASQLFFTPLSFNFDDSKFNLTDIGNIDNQGLTFQFFRSAKVADNQIKPHKISQKRNLKPRRVPANVKRSKFPRRPKKRFTRKLIAFFRFPSIKIESTKKELLVDSSTYLGETSPFVTEVSGRVDLPSIEPEVYKITNLLNSAQVKTRMNKFKFDLTTPNSALGQFISSKGFKPSKLRRAPISWKALVCSRSSAAKNEILSTGGDILQNPETKISSEIVFQTNQKLEVLSGYKKDLNNDYQLSAPIWTEIDFDLLPSIGGSICRMSYAEIPELGLSIDDKFKLPSLDQVFIVADNPVTVNISELPPGIRVGGNINMESKNSLSLNIKYATTNIVTQNIRKDALVSAATAATIGAEFSTTMQIVPVSPSMDTGGRY